MTSLSNVAAGLVFGLVLTATLPAFGANRVIAAGQNARAQAVMQDIGHDGIVSLDRARALRDCNDRVGGFAEQSLGTTAWPSIAPAWQSARLSEAIAYASFSPS